jgi:hypothetical protein
VDRARNEVLASTVAAADSAVCGRFEMAGLRTKACDVAVRTSNKTAADFRMLSVAPLPRCNFSRRLPSTLTWQNKLFGAELIEFPAGGTLGSPNRDEQSVMQNDEIIWQVINHQFCSFKAKYAALLLLSFPVLVR